MDKNKGYNNNNNNNNNNNSLCETDCVSPARRLARRRACLGCASFS
jgi:hypothetical protein